MTDYNIDFALEEINIDNDVFRFKARSITKDFVCEKGLDRLAHDSVNKPLVWRHEHPIIPDFKNTHIYGTVLESIAEDGSILSEYDVYNHTDDHRKVREVIKRRYELGEPIKISMRFRQYDRGGSPIHYDVIEHSLTPTPACAECKMIDFVNESDIMPDKTDEQKKTEELEKIKALEADLTKKEKLLEDLEVKIVTLEKSVSEKDKILEEKEGERKEILDKLLELNDKFKEQEKVVDELKEARKMDELNPLIERAVKEDGELMRPLYTKEAKSLVKEGKFEDAKKFLLERVKDLEKEKPMAEVKDLRESAEEVIDEELEDEGLKNKRDRTAFRNMPPEFTKWFNGDK